LLGRLAQAATAARLDPQAALDNAIGLLVQTHDASAGLIGNSLVQLARRPELRRQLRDHQDLLPGLIAEVARYDAPVQNTRRFLGADAVIAGVPLPAGACVLLLLAAANRDAAANPEPERFEITRPARRSWTFGGGLHACPGARLAQGIAAAALTPCLEWEDGRWEQLRQPRYRASLNARIPRFHPEEARP
ncbi:MAG: cytochrome P450, partial [Pseudomonas sp.]